MPAIGRAGEVDEPPADEKDDDDDDGGDRVLLRPILSAGTRLDVRECFVRFGRIVVPPSTTPPVLMPPPPPLAPPLLIIAAALVIPGVVGLENKKKTNPRRGEGFWFG